MPPAAPDLTIVIPTYNERTRIGELVEQLFGEAGTHRIALEVVIVDDNSPDGTGAVADELTTRHRVRVVHRAGKLGLGSAVSAGFAQASAPVFGVMDADFSHPPAIVPRMYRAFVATGCDFLVASRYIPGGSTRNWPLRRQLMSRIGCLLAAGLTPIVDATSGFFMLKPAVAERAGLRASGFKLCLELLTRGRPRKLVEVPYVFDERQQGESKMTTSEGTGYLRQLVRLYSSGERTARTVEYRRLSPAEVEGMAHKSQPPDAN